MLQSFQMAPQSKWIKGVSSRQSLPKAAFRILRARFSSVLYWLPLAAHRSEEDDEYIHQLRVSTRRAVAALQMFSGLVPKSDYRQLRERFRAVRRAADEARNLDVLCAHFVDSTDTSFEATCHIVEAIRRRRQEAQRPVVAIYQQLEADDFSNVVAHQLERIKGRAETKKAKGKPKFGEQAPRYLKPVLQKFFKAAGADLSDDAALHRLRIATKKLRYTMELVGPAFKPRFRKGLYRRISRLQDVMGMVNDHATARQLFSEWVSQTDDLSQQAFFRGILFAEAKAHEDIRQAFDVIWTPKAVKKLRRDFRACCGLP